MTTLIDQAELRRVLAYDPATGIFTWRLPMSKRIRVGMVAGSDLGKSPTGKKMVQIGIHKRNYLANRLAWLYVTGAWPIGVVDHRDGDHTNQRWTNLRDVTQKINVENQRRPAKHNTSSGLLGVSWFDRDSVWLAKIGITVEGRKRTVYLGRFKDKHLAHEAYLTAKRQLHAGCTI